MNSYKHNDNRVLFRKWSPEMSFEEMHRRKREREDDYIKKIYPEERPVLLIKEKHVYTDIEIPQETDMSYFKVSENTAEVNDIDIEIREQENFIRRYTLVHGSNRPVFQAQDDPSAVYKVEGIEFLPEGFLELDPLLYKDEYTFDSKINEKIFQEQQMRAKRIRRKQYWQRNQNKVRDVTIYVVDGQRSRILEYLDKWYFENKHKMDDDEIEMVSKDLNVDKDKMMRLQDLYLEKKKLENTQKLSHYLNQKGRLTDNQLHVPESLKKYFVKTKDKKETSLAMDKNKSPYMKAYLQKYGIKKLKTPFASRIDPVEEEKNVEYAEGYQSQVEDLKNSNGKYTSLKVLPKINSSSKMNKLNASQAFKKSDKTLSTGKSKEGLKIKNDPNGRNWKAVKKNTDADPDLQNYFSVQINDILNRLRSIDLDEEKRISNRTENQVSQEHYENLMEEQLKNLILNSKPHNRSFKQSLTANDAPVEEPKKSMKSETVEAFGIAQKSTIVVNTQKGNKLIVRKLRPTMILTEYYFHTINEFINEEGSRKATFITKNENGDIMHEEDIKPELLGDYYDTLLKFAFEGNNSQGVQIVLNNDRGEEVIVQELNAAHFTYLADDHYANLKSVCDVEGNRRSTVQVEQTNSLLVKKHTMKPILIGSMYYQQIVEEVFDDMGIKKAVVIVKDEDGKVLVLEEINTDDIIDQYYSDLVEETIDQTGKRKATLVIKNNKEEVIKKISIYPCMLDTIGEKYINDAVGEVLEEVIDDNKNTRITVLVVDEKQDKILYQEYRPNVEEIASRKTSASKIKPIFLGNEYYHDVIEDIMDNIRSRKSTVIRPKASSLDKKLVEEYMKKLKEGLVIDYEPAKSRLSSRKPTYICNQYYVEMINDALLERGSPEISKNYESEYESFHYNVDNLASNHLKNLTEDAFARRDRLESVVERRKSSFRPSQVNEENMKSIIENFSRNSSNITNLRPTIVGEDYYGQIVNQMLIHPSNQALIYQTDDEILVRPTLVVNNYYQNLMEEVNLHRKRLLTATEVMLAINEPTSHKKSVNFKELEERYTIELLCPNEDHNNDDTLIKEFIDTIESNYHTDTIDVNEKLLDFEDIKKEPITVSKKVSMKKRLPSKPNDNTYVTDEGDFKSFEDLPEQTLGVTKDEIYKSFDNNRNSMSKLDPNKIEEARHHSMDRYESFENDKKNDESLNEDVLVKISDRGSQLTPRMDESRRESQFQSLCKEEMRRSTDFNQSPKLTNLTYESKTRNDRFKSLQENNNPRNEESFKSIVDESAELNSARRRSSLSVKKDKSSEALNRYSDRQLTGDDAELMDNTLSDNYLSQRRDDNSLLNKSRSENDNFNVFGSFKDKIIPAEETHDHVGENLVEQTETVNIDQRVSTSDLGLKSPNKVSNSTEMDFKAFKKEFNDEEDDIPKANEGLLLDSQITEKVNESQSVDNNIRKTSEKDILETRPTRNTDLLNKVGNEMLEERISKLMEEMENEPDKDMVEKIEARISELRTNKDSMKDFEHFCRFILPEDQDYQESIALMTMFYHFLDKKNLLK